MLYDVLVVSGADGEKRFTTERDAPLSVGDTFERARSLIIDDAFGLRWELNTFAYDHPPNLSTGARTGRWLEVKPAGEQRHR
jgi:hypothetical protein